VNSVKFSKFRAHFVDSRIIKSSRFEIDGLCEIVRLELIISQEGITLELKCYTLSSQHSKIGIKSNKL
jgi:hypothetical protein